MDCKNNEHEINSPSELYDLILEKNIEHLLLGNGFGLSHPTLSKAFNFDFNSVFNEIKNLLQEKISFTSCEKRCPEKFLKKITDESPEQKQEKIRLKAIEAIINSYINAFTKNLCGTEKLWNLYAKESYSCNEFLGIFKHIYTLNYDPLMYFEFLKLLDNERLHHKDGFKVEKGEAITQKKIVSNLKEYEYTFRYLHGSYFLNIDKESQELKKLGRDIITRKVLHERIIGTDRSIRPFLILEGTSESKMNHINKHDYFKHCYHSLKKTEPNILVFGVSFENDDHILDALKNEQICKVFITYIDEEVKQKIQKKIPKDMMHKFVWIKLSVNNCIWMHDEIDDAINQGLESHYHSLQEQSNGNPTRWMADCEDAISSELPELISFIEKSRSIEDIANSADNNLHDYLIKSPILDTEIQNRIDFHNLRDSMLISLGCLQHRNSLKFNI